MRVLELFGGIGACSNALKRLGINFEIADYVEIDKYAVKSFNAIYNTNFEPQDIRNWGKDLQVDLIMHGSPCQDFSIAGRQAGGNEGSGTRSSLMYETIRILEKLKPKYVVWENVKNILSKKHKHNFDNYISKLNELGYKSYYQILNAKDYGIPQNRERVFTISIRNDLNQPFEFPPKQELKLKLKDLLESEVDEKYYLSKKLVNCFYNNEQKQMAKGNTFKFVVSDGSKIAKTITTQEGSRMCDNFIKCVGKLDIKGKDEIKRVYSTKGISPTLNTMQGGNRQPKIMIGASRGHYFESPQMHNYNYRIRKLTPKECWRLMGFSDKDFEKAAKVNSNTQLYKQAGNSIVVNVLETIFRNLFNDKGD